MVLLDLRPQKLDGARVESVLEAANIACNKNSIPGDRSALTPCGLRIGTPAMTSRGFGNEAFIRVAGFIDTLVKLTIKIQSELPPAANKLKDFKGKVASRQVEELEKIRQEVATWAISFPLPV